METHARGRKGLGTVAMRRLTGNHRYVLMIESTPSGPNRAHWRWIDPNILRRRSVANPCNIHIDCLKRKKFNRTNSLLRKMAN